MKIHSWRRERLLAGHKKCLQALKSAKGRLVTKYWLSRVPKILQMPNYRFFILAVCTGCTSSHFLTFACNCVMRLKTDGCILPTKYTVHMYVLVSIQKDKYIDFVQIRQPRISIFPAKQNTVHIVIGCCCLIFIFRHSGFLRKLLITIGQLPHIIWFEVRAT